MGCQGVVAQAPAPGPCWLCCGLSWGGHYRPGPTPKADGRVPGPQALLRAPGDMGVTPSLLIRSSEAKTQA